MSRFEALRVTWGSEVRSQEVASPSTEDTDARDADTLGELGANIRSRMWFERQRGTGRDSYDKGQSMNV